MRSGCNLAISGEAKAASAGLKRTGGFYRLSGMARHMDTADRLVAPAIPDSVRISDDNSIRMTSQLNKLRIPTPECPNMMNAKK